MSWSTRAWAAIDAATRDLPADTPLDERVRIVDAAYPFGERRHHPYRIWLECRRVYLSRFGWRSPRRLTREREEA
jgi:hypothetical protein